MDKMKDLKDLLRHEVLDLCSAEDQMIEAMPAMIERATNPELKKALREHLRISEAQRKRLDQVTKLLGEESGDGSNEGGVGNFIAGLFGGGDHKCKAMEGLITEGNRMMKEDMNEEVMDAAIISCSQKIEHYEICGYGTAKAFARELQLKEVENLLNQTLNEEYEADNRLTRMAVGGGLNEMAEMADGNNGSRSTSGRNGGNRGNKSSAGKKSASGNSSTGGKKSASNKSASGKKSSGSSSSSASKGATKKSSSGGSSSSGKKSSASGSSSSGKKSSSGGSNSSGKKSSTGGSSSSGKKSSSGGSKASAGSKGGKKSASGGGKKSAGSKGGSSRGGGRGR